MLAFEIAMQDRGFTSKSQKEPRGKVSKMYEKKERGDLDAHCQNITKVSRSPAIPPRSSKTNYTIMKHLEA